MHVLCVDMNTDGDDGFCDAYVQDYNVYKACIGSVDTSKMGLLQSSLLKTCRVSLFALMHSAARVLHTHLPKFGSPWLTAAMCVNPDVVFNSLRRNYVRFSALYEVSVVLSPETVDSEVAWFVYDFLCAQMLVEYMPELWPVDAVNGRLFPLLPALSRGNAAHAREHGCKFAFEGGTIRSCHASSPAEALRWMGALSTILRSR